MTRVARNSFKGLEECECEKRINHMKIQDTFYPADSDPLVALPKQALYRFLLRQQLAESGHSSKLGNSTKGIQFKVKFKIKSMKRYVRSPFLLRSC